jgi:hypothetical protein
LTAQLGFQASAGFLRTDGSCALQVAQLSLHVGLEGAGNGGGELHGTSGSERFQGPPPTLTKERPAMGRGEWRENHA